MNDLFSSIEESRIEREGIKIDSGMSPADAVEQTREELHASEIKSVIRWYYPHGDKAAAYFELVEKKRGTAAAERLRADCRIAWAKAREVAQKDSEVNK